MKRLLIAAVFGVLSFASGLAFAQGQGMENKGPSTDGAPHEEQGLKGNLQNGTPQSGTSQDSGSVSDMGKMGKQNHGKGRMSRAKRGDVREAQQKLKEDGFNPGPVDGILGPRTSSALRKFQNDHGIKATGRLDRKTRQMLMASNQTRSPESSPGSTGQENAPGGTSSSSGSGSSGSSSGSSGSLSSYGSGSSSGSSFGSGSGSSDDSGNRSGS